MFSKRHYFSIIKVNSKKSILQKASINQSIETVQFFHLSTRACQISESNDPIRGYTSLKAAFNIDEVPLALGDSNEYTMQSTG